MWNKTGESLGALWCGLMHESVMWPIHGQYECRTCGRHFPALVEARTETRIEAPAIRRAQRPSWPTALLAAALIIAPQFAAPARAENLRDVERANANAVLERHAIAETQTWSSERMEISASLPKLRQDAHLEAIRTLEPQGEPKYDVLTLTGDATVRNQVIVRYLKAERRASELAPGSATVNAANYRIAYKGLATYTGGVAYVFQLTPRKKRDGLIKGELWLDRETGAVVRQSGYLVKSPSMWIKRIHVTLENVFRNRALEARHTEVTVETRLVGRAELVIEERPLAIDGGAESGGQ
jgi:outer membrane lipoprotein-sorting protein